MTFKNTQVQTLSDDELNKLIAPLEQTPAIQDNTLASVPKTQEQINQEALQILSTAQDKAQEQVLAGTSEVSSIFYWGAGFIIVIGTLQLLAILAIKTLKKQKAKQQ